MKTSCFSLLFFLLSSCEDRQKSLFFYKKKFDKKKYSVEATHIAKKILFLSKQKNKPSSFNIPYLIYLAKYSANVDRRVFYQEQLAITYFKNPLYLNKAIQIWFNLIKETKDRVKKRQYQFFLAKAYLKNKKYKQAILELDSIVVFKEKFIFKIKRLKIQIFVELKKWQKVIVLYKYLKKQFYSNYKKQELALDLVFIYEHLALHHLALKELRDLKSYYIFPHFIERRIITIKKRIKNQPKVRR